MNKILAQDIKGILASAAQPVLAAYVLGSVAVGREKASSDIDLAILCPGLETAEKIRLWQAIADLTERAVDWIDLDSAGTLITLEALRGTRLLGSSELHAQLLSRALVDASDFGMLHERILQERREAWFNE